MTLALRQRFIDIAASQIGRKETDGPNVGPDVLKYQQATWLQPGGWPWCAAFTAWCLREWLIAPDARRIFNLANDEQVERWRCRDARAFGWEDWAKKRGLTTFGESGMCKLGDLVTFDNSHIGIIAADRAGDYIESIDGNTDMRGSREGDGVWRRRRHWQRARCYIRLLP